MIRKIRISNYKSIPDLTLDLGRVTVLIGANGSGKSNILEAIALASAAIQNKLDNEFLISGGIRVTDTRFMRSAFGNFQKPKKPEAMAVQHGIDTPDLHAGLSSEKIGISARGDDTPGFFCQLEAKETATYPKWTQLIRVPPEVADRFYKNTPSAPLTADYLYSQTAGTLPGFLIYAPENSVLRTFQSEGQILPLGIKGEGLFAHLKALNSEKNRPRLAKIKEKLTLIDWFESFDIPGDLSPGERSIRIRDRYLPESALFDQRSANEGFLFLLFYITLLISPDTPAFFSIDNLETSLNPKLCISLLQQIAALAKEYDKQVIVTTHNPAVLDGLDLHDDEERLLVADRNKAGHTRLRRIDPPKSVPGQVPVSLSEAFMRGYIGGLPKNF